MLLLNYKAQLKQQDFCIFLSLGFWGLNNSVKFNFPLYVDTACQSRRRGFIVEQQSDVIKESQMKIKKSIAILKFQKTTLCHFVCLILISMSCIDLLIATLSYVYYTYQILTHYMQHILYVWSTKILLLKYILLSMKQQQLPPGVSDLQNRSF